MIDKIHIQNFKCLRDVEIELGPFNVLIGPNDSGKTSFLDALQWLGKKTLPGNPDSFVWQRARQTSVVIQVIGVCFDAKERLPSFEVSVKHGPQNVRVFAEDEANAEEAFKKKIGIISSEHPFEIRRLEAPTFDYRLEMPPSGAYPSELLNVGKREVFKRQDSTVYVLGDPNTYSAERNNLALHQVLEYARNVDPKEDDLGEVAGLLASIRGYQFDPKEMRQPVQGPQNTQEAAALTLDPRGGNLAAVLYAILSGADRQATLDLEEQLHAQIPTLKGVSTPPAAGAGTFQIHFTLNIEAKPPVTIPSAQASDGAMLLLGYLALVYGNAPQVLLVEEPENGLHPSRLKFVVDLLRKISTGEIGNKPRQVILTTHSPLLLNFVEPREVRIFRRDPEKGTEITAMDKIPNIERLSKDFAPGELWYLYGEEDLITGHAT